MCKPEDPSNGEFFPLLLLQRRPPQGGLVGSSADDVTESLNSDFSFFGPHRFEMLADQACHFRENFRPRPLALGHRDPLRFNRRQLLRPLYRLVRCFSNSTVVARQRLDTSVHRGSIESGVDSD
jgi:hypothetical protein